MFQVVTRRQGPFPHRIADVGVVMDLATHDIDLTSWVTGQEYTSVSARTVSRSGRLHEDMVAVVGQLADGTMVNHLVNWLSPLKERSTVITGDRGCFVADTLTADLTFYANGAIDTEWEALRAFRGVAEGDMVRYAIPKREPLLVEHERFRDAVEGKESDIVTLRQGLRTVQVAAALLASASDGSTIEVTRGDAATPRGDRRSVLTDGGSRPSSSIGAVPGAPRTAVSILSNEGTVHGTARSSTPTRGDRRQRHHR